MITIGMNYQIIPGKEGNFERVFANVFQDMMRIEGHVRSHLYKDVNDTQSYLIVSEWHSEDAFETFIHSEKFQNVANWGKENILLARPVHTVYRQ